MKAGTGQRNGCSRTTEKLLPNNRETAPEQPNPDAHRKLYFITAKILQTMANLKLKIKKTLLKMKIDGVTKTGYYGRVITNGTKSIDDILKASTHGSTLDYREAKLAVEMIIDGIADNIKQGYIVDLGVLGKLYPAVNGKWAENADDLSLTDLKPKVTYKAGDDIAAAVKGASLSWTTEAETDDNTVTTDTDGDDDDMEG